MPGQRLCLCHLRRALRSGGGYTAGGRGYSTLPHARHAGGLDFRGVSARLTGDTLRRGDPRQGASGMTLNQLFDLSLCQRRDETGLEWQGRSFTFGEIGSRARRLASTLRSRGFRPGDRLAVQLANCVELIDLYLACWNFKGWFNIGVAGGGCLADWFSVFGDATSPDNSIELQILPQSTWQYMDDPMAQRQMQQQNQRDAQVGMKPCPVHAPFRAEEFIRQNLIPK